MCGMGFWGGKFRGSGGGCMCNPQAPRRAASSSKCLLFRQFAIISSFCLFLAVAPSLFAQTTSTITGTVHDKQGLAVAGAQIQASSSELAIERTTTSHSDGTYCLTAIPPGIYEIKASKDGF